MSTEKQPGNAECRQGETQEQANAREARARASWAAMVGEAKTPATVPEAKALTPADEAAQTTKMPEEKPAVSPLVWSKESVQELRKVVDRLRLGKTEYEGSFTAPKEGGRKGGPHDALGRAREVLTAVQVESMFQQKTFSFRASEPVNGQGIICMGKVSYKFMLSVLEEKSRALLAGGGAPPRPGA